MCLHLNFIKKKIIIKLRKESETFDFILSYNTSNLGLPTCIITLHVAVFKKKVHIYCRPSK